MEKTKLTLIDAIQNGELTVVEKCLSDFPELANATNEQGLSLLLLAKYYQKEDIANTLLQYKSTFDIFEAAASGQVLFLEKHLNQNPQDLNLFASDGFTPLGLACFFGKKEVVKILLEEGADPNIASNNSMKIAPLHSAVAVSNIDIVKLLLQKNADPNAAQHQGVTALHSAAHNGSVEIVKLLLEKGANPNPKMDDGKTPIDFAKEDGFPEIVKLLAD